MCLALEEILEFESYLIKNSNINIVDVAMLEVYEIRFRVSTSLAEQERFHVSPQLKQLFNNLYKNSAYNVRDYCYRRKCAYLLHRVDVNQFIIELNSIARTILLDDIINEI